MLRLPSLHVALSTSLILGASTCAAHATPTPGVSAVMTVAAASEAPHIDPHIDPDSALGRARAAMALGLAAEAQRIAEEAIDERIPLDAAELRWVAARAAQRQQDLDIALAHFEAVAASEVSPLRRWGALAHAELLRYRDPAAAAAKAESLVSESFAGAERARRLGLRPDTTPVAPGPDDAALAEAHALYRGLRYDDAARAFRRIAARTSDDAVRCEARLHEGSALERARDRRRAAPILASVADDCADPDLRATARYRAGRAYQAAGERDAALAQFLALPRELPEHRLADDGLVLAARLVERDDPPAAEALYRQLAYVHGRGDMVPEALFRLYWAARSSGTHAEALPHIEAIDAAAEAESQSELRGRSSYWRARTLADLSRGRDAADAYEATARAYPLSYYAQLAIHRLGELDAERAAALLTEMADVASPTAPALPAGAAARRATALLRVGEPQSAAMELEAADLLGPRASDESIVAVAALYHATGATPLAIELARAHSRVFRGSLPVGAGRTRFRAAYPLAFAPLIEDIAAGAGVPAELLRAVAREESSFSPTVVSHAHAYGLIQIILPTAEHIASGVGLEPTPALLRQPDANLRFGAEFIRRLLERFEGQAAFIPPAYNAGPGALDRWLAGKSGQPFDALVEEIPYDETRRYTRRVLESYGVYSFLASAQLPELPRTLP